MTDTREQQIWNNKEDNEWNTKEHQLWIAEEVASLIERFKQEYPTVPNSKIVYQLIEQEAFWYNKYNDDNDEQIHPEVFTEVKVVTPPPKELAYVKDIEPCFLQFAEEMNQMVDEVLEEYDVPRSVAVDVIYNEVSSSLSSVKISELSEMVDEVLKDYESDNSGIETTTFETNNTNE